MTENTTHMREHYKKFIELLNPCMDDYLFVYDVQGDHYQISEGVLERFPLPGAEFSDVVKTLEGIIVPEDFVLLMQDFDELAKGKDYHDMHYRWLDRKGNPQWINCRGIVIRDENGTFTYLVGCVNETGMQQKADNISGLLGDFSLKQELQAGINKEPEGFMLRLGIDKFKEINEEKGIDYGNMVLRKTAECISQVILPDQKLFRVVADEFAILDMKGRDIGEAKLLYEQIRIKINKFIEQTGYEVFFTISGGILDFKDVKNDYYKNVMMLSEFALNSAKDAGRNQYYIYNDDDYQAFQKRKDLIQVMRRAIVNDYAGFEVYYQPIVDITDNVLTGAEALLRFKTRERGMISPAEFIPLLEESGLIVPVGKWILSQAMGFCNRIQKIIPSFRISINLSYIQVMRSDVLKDIVSGIREHGLRPGSVIIELTESGSFEMNAAFMRFREGLRNHGVMLALDDFGTGYSNFSYLYEIGPNTIKIDRSLTMKALKNENEFRLLQHMINMSHSVEIKFCVEGIESKDELERITSISPDYIQGYYYGKPCPEEQFIVQFTQQDADTSEQRFKVLKRNPLYFDS